jgi:lysophospholipase L1-like esterase
VVVQTAGDAGNFEAAGVPKRLPDGFHMSERGAQIVWERIEPQVVQLLDAETAR